MSGKRCHRLREQFFAEHGRYPRRTRTEVKNIGGFFSRVITAPSEWRKVKRAHIEARRAA